MTKHDPYDESCKLFPGFQIFRLVSDYTVMTGVVSRLIPGMTELVYEFVCPRCGTPGLAQHGTFGGHCDLEWTIFDNRLILARTDGEEFILDRKPPQGQIPLVARTRIKPYRTLKLRPRPQIYKTEEPDLDDTLEHVSRIVIGLLILFGIFYAILYG